MANQDAWDKGWALGAGRKKGMDDASDTDLKETKKKTGSSAWAKGIDLLQNAKLLPKFKKGGEIKKTGLVVLHKGEYVVPVKHRSVKKTTRKGSQIKR